MRNAFIFGVVWLAIIVGIVSFGVTLFFLDDNSKQGEASSVTQNVRSDENYVYETNQTAIRTNEMAYLGGAYSSNNSKNESYEKVKNRKDESVETIGKNSNFFIRPVKGGILNPFSPNELIYSKTLAEWNIHQGTDYKAKIGEEVVAIDNGKIKQVDKNDKYGEFIVIEHTNGYESLYANLTVLDALKEGSSVEKGQLIGYVAESFGFEVAEETHLHLEVKKDGKYLSI